MPEIRHKHGAHAIGGMTAFFLSRSEQIERTRPQVPQGRQKERSQLPDG